MSFAKWPSALTAANRGILAKMPMPARIELEDDVDESEDLNGQRDDVRRRIVTSRLLPMKAPPPPVVSRQPLCARVIPQTHGRAANLGAFRVLGLNLLVQGDDNQAWRRSSQE